MPQTRLLLLSLATISAAFAWQENVAVKMPAPYATPSANNGPKVIAPPDSAHLTVPAGFAVDEYAAGFGKPRFLLLGPGNEILVADSAGAVYALIDNQDHKNPERKKLVEGLERPSGLAIWKDYLYIAELTSVKRYKYDAKAMTLGTGEEVVSLKGYTKGHWTRSLVFDRKGEKLYVGVGSGSNVDTGDPENRAAIYRYNPDGSGGEMFAYGIRNPVGIHWAPGTDTLWASTQERDGLGDDLVPDYFTHVQQGGFYGWPFAYIGPNEEPRHKGEREDLVKKTIVPDILLPAHMAVMDHAFYTARQFPAKYRHGAFLAFHGSSNRAQRVGYSVGFVPFQNGKPSGPMEDFLTGWMTSPDSKEVWGRPVGVLQMADGSLLISDDGGNKLWRIHYGK